MTIEDLVGRLKAADDRMDVDSITEQAGRLLLTEEDWLARWKNKQQSEGSSNSGKQKSGGGGGSEKKQPVVKLTSEGTPRRKGKCRNCGIYGHWKIDCKKPKKERREEAHHAQAEPDHPALLVVTVNSVHGHGGQVVHLNEENVFPEHCDEDDNVWVPDTGASNHMTGCRQALASLDTTVGGTVCFGDGLLVEIVGTGSVMLQTKKSGHKVLTEVYYIPKLKK